MINEDKDRCKRFSIVACKEIRSRFDLSNSLWTMAAHLHPQAIMDRSLRTEVPVKCHLSTLDDE